LYNERIKALIMKPIPSIIAVISFSILIACSPYDDYHQPGHKDWLETHGYAIGQTSLMLEDTSRNRPLKTEIWYPTQDTTGTNVAEDYPFKLPRTSQNLGKTLPFLLKSSA
jgi:hypothetical protein